MIKKQTLALNQHDHPMRIRDMREDRVFNILNTIFFVIVLFIIVYPLYFILIASFSDPNAVMNGKVIFRPVDVSLVGYNAIMKFTKIWRGYGWSFIYTISGTAISVVLTMLLAYALSRSFFGKGLINGIIVFTMFFSGGLIPTFLVMKDLGLYNNPIIIIIMGAVSVWNTMIARTFIQTSLPEGLYEAAEIDGASHTVYFFKIVLPLSSTIVAVLAVYYAVGRWNDYFTALIYLKDANYWPLQTVLRQILASLTISGSDYAEALGDDFANAAEAQRIANSVKYCSIIISTVPAVVLYIFLQDYFVKGVMIGSLKG